MSDADVSSSTALDISMKGQSRLIVILGTSQIVKQSVKQLKTLGRLTRVARGVFIIHGPINKGQSTLQELPAMTFQKAREIPSVSERGEEASIRRVYSVVSYSFKSPTAIQKKRVERLVRNSTAIRLRPGVLLFPVLKSKDRRKLLESDERNKLMDSRRISQELASLGAEVARWSRLRLANQQSKVHDALVRTVSHDISSFEVLARDLRNQARDPEAQPKQLRKRYMVLAKRYRELKVKWRFANLVWNYDSKKLLTRAYNMMLATRRLIESTTL